MGRKMKPIDKKNSATFRLMARDTSDPNYTGELSSDRVFVRVDTNSYSVPGFGDEVASIDQSGFPGETSFDDDPDSLFADAPEDEDGDYIPRNHVRTDGIGRPQLPDHIRREILELGLPDDGYNYLQHLREIKNAGGGSTFYQNPKAKLDELPLDVKAYDASRVRITEVDGNLNGNSIYDVSSNIVIVRTQKAADPEVNALLDDSDMSRFGSDVEDLEEDFVVKANCPEEDDAIVERVRNLRAQFEVVKRTCGPFDNYVNHEDEIDLNVDGVSTYKWGLLSGVAPEQPRVRRLLDEQFDMLAIQEYGTDDDSDYVGCEIAEDESLVEMLSHADNDNLMNDLVLGDEYKVPADILRANEGPRNEELVNSAADVLQRCVEYAKRYENEDQDDAEVVIVQESSNESEMWDCETIVSTYSNLDNHPGRIEAPETTRKKKLAQSLLTISTGNNQLISLRGKEKLPVDFLPHSRKVVSEKPSRVSGLRHESHKRRSHGEESKEEKKERKAAVKEERREARRVKKEMKGLYKCEAQRAQKAVAISGPTSIHLM